MKNKYMIRKYVAILALTVFSMFTLEACAKEPAVEEPIGITMTTKASKVSLAVAGTGDFVIDWGDGKKSNMNDTFEYDEKTKRFWFSHDYSGTTPHYIAITGNITKLFCSNNELTALNVSGSSELAVLNCALNQLTALDVSKNTALKELLIEHNQLTALDVSKNPALTHLRFNNNRLTNLNLSAANTALVVVTCAHNQLTSSALNDLFKRLPDVTKNKRPGGSINIQDNPGTADCDPSIAREKGWSFIIR